MAQLDRVEPAVSVPPQDQDAEESVLGAMMLAPAAVDRCVAILDPADFYVHKHGRIFQAAVDLHAKGEPVDALTVTAELRTRGQLDPAGGQAYVYGLANSVPASANVAHYAELVVDAARRRALIRLGGEIAQLGWKTEGEPADLEDQALELTRQIGTRRAGTSSLDVETWAQFERSATEMIPTLIDELWPTGALGFIAAPPKKGKTWIGLSAAISVATGQPFLSRFPVTTPQPVVYLALEGHRAAIRGRIGVLARGMNLDPDQGSHDLDNLHVVYKPRGLNLSDPAWVRIVRDAVEHHQAQLLLIDVLRRAAVLKENDNTAFAEFLFALDPIAATGCAIGVLHHFGKLTEISKERSPGERMSGAGAMYGAFDVGIFITGSDEGARRLRIDFETRDLAAPDTLGLHLAGDTTGKNGGFVYRDTAAWEHEDPVDEEDLTANAAELIEWLDRQPDRQASTAEIAYGLNISVRTITRRRHSWTESGIVWTPRKGNTPATYSLPEGFQIDPDLSRQANAATCPHKTVAAQESLDLEGLQATPIAPRHDRTPTPVRMPETPDLQEEPHADSADSPTESASADAMPLNGNSDTPDEHDEWLDALSQDVTE